jgi:hypothetical protein
MKLFAVIDLSELGRSVPIVCAYPFFAGCLMLGFSFLGVLNTAPKFKVSLFYFGLGLASLSLLSGIATEILIGLLSGMAAG